MFVFQKILTFNSYVNMQNSTFQCTVDHIITNAHVRFLGGGRGFLEK